MQELFLRQLDYIFFIYGASFLLLAAMAWRRKDGSGLSWRWLALFGLIHGANEWLDMFALSLGDPEVFRAVRLAVMTVSFVCLFEFGRRAFRGSGQAVGTWIYIPVGLTIAAGALGGLSGINAASRYTLCLPGALLAGAALLSRAAWAEGAPRWPRILTGVALSVYALASGLIVVPAGFLPASFLNQTSFLDLTGIPVQLVRTACAFLAALGIWFENREIYRRASGRIGWFHSWITPLAVSVLIALGFFFVNWRAQAVDHRMRHHLTSTVFQLASTINVDRVKALTFTSADRDKPEFRRLEEQLTLWGEYTGLYNIYTMALRNGTIVFGPENIPEGSAIASPPGTIYEKPRPQDLAAFLTGKPYSVGPSTDEYGTFVSVAAPVFDPRSGKVLMLVGIDIEASLWLAEIARYRLGAIGTVSFLLSWILLGYWLLNFRLRLSQKERYRFRHIEGSMIFVLGMIIAGIVTAVFYENSLEKRHEDYRSAAETRAVLVRTFFEGIRRDMLPGLVGIFEGDEEVRREEFRRHTEYLVRDFVLAGCGWAPRVRADQRQAFEEEMRRTLSPDFMIHVKDAAGKKVAQKEQDEYYPLLFVEPYEEIKSAIGYDITESPERWQAVTTSVKTGLLTASDPIFRVSNNEPAVNIYLPVSGRASSGVHGVVYLTFRPEALLRNIEALFLEELPVAVDLFQLKKGQKPIRLATNRQHDILEYGEHILPDYYWEHMSLAYPMTFFGKTYVVLVHPLAGEKKIIFWEMLGIFCIGLGLSAILAWLIGYLVNRREELEVEVEIRSAQLKDSEETYRRQFSDNSAVMLLIDPDDGKITAANRAAEEFYGYPREKLLAWHITDIAVPAVSGTQADMSSSMAAGAKRLEFQCRLADGSLRDVEVSASPIEISGHRRVHLIVQDVTERKDAEKARDAQAYFLQTLMDAIPNPLFYKDVTGRYQACNASFERYLGRAKGELIGKTVYDVAPQDLADKYSQMDRLMFEGQEAQIYEGKLKYADGSFRDVLFNKALYRNIGGDIVGLVGVMTDISERKRSEEALKAAQAQLIQAEKMSSLGQLAAGVAHEINNPTGFVLSNSYTLKDYGENLTRFLKELTALHPGDDLSKAVEDLKARWNIPRIEEDLSALINETIDGAERIKKIVHGLTSFARPGETGMEEGDINECMEGALNVSWNALKYKADVIKEYGALPPVMFNKQQIAQVFVNLLVNAAQAIESHGTITIRTYVLKQDLFIEVSDTGKGIKPEHMSKIFDPFFTTKPVGQGTGLGLSIVHRIIEDHKGYIEVTSRIDHGTTFIVRLPLMGRDRKA